jgi:hypothetical protein
VLGIREVNLGSCWYEQGTIKQLRTGDPLAPYTRQFKEELAHGLGSEGIGVLLFSKKFRNEILPRFEREGYGITRGSVEHIVEWYDPERKTTHEVVLPRVWLTRQEG